MRIHNILFLTAQHKDQDLFNTTQAVEEERMPPLEVGGTTSSARAESEYELENARDDDDERISPSTTQPQSLTKPNDDQNMERLYQTTLNSHATTLKGLYMVTIYLCYAMVFWILIAPASWMIGRSRIHREVILPLLIKTNFFFLASPQSIITKYQSHDLVHFTHILPAAIWAALIPFQLHPSWRNRHRKLHRQMGYLILTSVLVMTVGVFVIFQRNLTYDKYFPDLEPHWFHDIQTPLQAGMALWFVFTALRAAHMARTKRLGAHSQWMIRHVASGIWISVQRMIFFALAICYFKARGQQTRPQFQRDFFALSGDLSWIICFCFGEYAAAAHEQLQQQQRRQHETTKKVQ